MGQRQAFTLLVLGVLIVTAALTWHFGWIGLLVPGAVVTLYAFTVDTDGSEKEVRFEDE